MQDVALRFIVWTTILECFDISDELFLEYSRNLQIHTAFLTTILKYFSAHLRECAYMSYLWYFKNIRLPAKFWMNCSQISFVQRHPILICNNLPAISNPLSFANLYIFCITKRLLALWCCNNELWRIYKMLFSRKSTTANFNFWRLACWYLYTNVLWFVYFLSFFLILTLFLN